MNKKQQEFLAHFIYESDAIETIYDDADLLLRQIRSDHKLGHVGALLLLEQLAADRKPLTHEIICRVQGLITAEQHLKIGGERLESEYIGQYRQVEVKVGGRVAPAFETVPVLMDEWLKDTNSVPLKHSYSVKHAELIRMVARSHFQYEFIHPFADGNGRSGRAFVYYCYRRLGFKPFVFPAVTRFHTYYQCFIDPARMEEYFLNHSK